MPCSRLSAIRRLTALYLERLLADGDFGLRVSLSDALCEENIETVRKLDLYPEYDAVTFLAACIAASLVATPVLSRRRHRQ
jgi:hypothetical protein